MNWVSCVNSAYLNWCYRSNPERLLCYCDIRLAENRKSMISQRFAIPLKSSYWQFLFQGMFLVVIFLADPDGQRLRSSLLKEKVRPIKLWWWALSFYGWSSYAEEDPSTCNILCGFFQGQEIAALTLDCNGEWPGLVRFPNWKDVSEAPLNQIVESWLHFDQQHSLWLFRRARKHSFDLGLQLWMDLV